MDTELFIKYSSVGIFTFFCEVALFALLVKDMHLHYVIATGLTFILGIAFQHEMNETTVYLGRKKTSDRFLRFALLMCINLMLSVFFMIVLVHRVHLPPVPARLIAGTAIGIESFLVTKEYIYN